LTTTHTDFDVLGIGNAIVDVLARSEADFLATQQLAKGTMTLVDEGASGRIYGGMGPGIERSGGSAANTIAGLASLGGKGAFIGKVRDDELGRVFAHDLQSLGVHFTTPPEREGPSTARCLIMVTPDAQRTMATYLGACVRLGPDDIEADTVRAAGITYLEGYLFDPPQAKEAFRRAASIAHGAGRRVALSLSDPFCVDRHREDFKQLLAQHIDVLFANGAEIEAMLGTTDPQALKGLLAPLCEIAVVTRGEHGSMIFSAGQVHEIPAARVERVLDTTGAGDLYASGFLLGLARGLPLPTCGALGGLCAAEVISHYGARPDVSLQQLAREAGLL
jgi:sugar/nucleoside kinase (ribokinase family)